MKQWFCRCWFYTLRHILTGLDGVDGLGERLLDGGLLVTIVLRPRVHDDHTHDAEHEKGKIEWSAKRELMVVNDHWS